MDASRYTRGVALTLMVLGVCGSGRAALDASAPDQAGTATVEFLAVSADGRPVTDLSVDEVTIAVDGRPRAIQSLRLARVPGAPDSPDVPPPPYGTSQPNAGRTVVFAVANAYMDAAAGKTLGDAIDRLLHGLAPRDRVALLTVPESVARVDLTSDLAAVRAALPGVMAASSVSREAAALESCAPRTVLKALERTITGFRAIDGPRALVMVASSFGGSAAVPSQDQRDSCYLADDYESLAAALAAERVHFYVAQATASASALNQGLQTVAQLAGATSVLPVSPASPDGLEAITRQTSAYYVATLDAGDGDRDGRAHALDLRVAREGVTTRTHAAVTFAPAGAAGSAPSVAEMLKVTRSYPALPLHVAAFVSRGPEGRLRLLVAGEAADPATELTAGAVGLIDRDGTLRQVTLNAQQLSASPVVVLLEAEPGSYRLRFAASSNDGAGGAADVNVPAELSRIGPYAFSGLVLGQVQTGSFVPALQFRNEPTAYAYLELYGEAAPGLALDAALVSSPEGEPIASLNLAGSRTPEPDKITLMAEIPIADLEPGDYVVRVVVSLDGQPDVRILRTLRKVR